MSNLPHYQQQQQTVTFAYSQGALQLTVLTPTIIRVFSNRGESGYSYAITSDKQQSTPITLTTMSYERRP